MDASRKRKANNATPSNTDGSATKKIKLVNTRDVPSTPAPARGSLVETVGQRLVDNLRRSQDKSGRPIASQFLTLPPRDELPDYYEFTKLPIAIDTIEDKIHDGGYNTVTEIESDFKRMVQNAKDYNSTGSEIYEDAERIRKLVYNYMKTHNPAYTENPNYASFPTPIPKPGEKKLNGATDGHGPNGQTSATPARNAKTKASSPSEPLDGKSSAVEAANGDNAEHESGVNFTGMSFQDAQFAIIDTLLKTTDEGGLEIFTPFANLPSRKLEDYYRYIKYPVSLKKVRKRVDGEHGRNEHTGITDFKSWDAFEEEISFIWRNAKDYNEDGSEMYELAGQLEEHFKSLLEAAKSKISGPAPPKIKLGGPKPKVTLNLSNNNRPSPTPATAASDTDAAKRHRQSVSAAAQPQQRQSPAVNGTKPATPQVTASVPATQEMRPPTAVAAPSPAEPVKLEKAVSQSPAVNPAVPVVATAPTVSTVATAPMPATTTITTTTNGSMPPPLVRPASSSPFPTGQPPFSSYVFTAPALLPPTPVRTYPLAEALIPAITIATHPHLKIPKPLQFAIPPHPTLAQQSRTITLPPSHYFLQISPTVSKTLSFGRPYKIFFTVNGIRLTQRETHQDGFLRTHMYEASLVQGVNRIEVEVAAQREQSKEGLDVEKCTVFANLQKL